MRYPLKSMKGLVIGAAVLLSGCSYFDDEPEIILEGERFPVIGLGRAIAVDPDAAGTTRGGSGSRWGGRGMSRPIDPTAALAEILGYGGRGLS